MSRRNVWLCGYLLLTCCVLPMLAQQPVASATNGSNVVVPPLVNFSTVLTDLNGKPLTKLTGVTFLLYKEEQGGAPLWMETQNVQPDKTGHYSVMLGSATSTGLPGDLFVAGEARWLGVQPQGQGEQPRVMLLSVPYALKAVDAETIGGLPPSAFVRTAPDASTSGNGSDAPASNAGTAGTSAKMRNAGEKAASSASETQNYVAKFTNGNGGLGNSLLFDNGTNVGVATSAPGFPLDVAGIVNAQKDIQGLGDLRVDFTGLNKGTLSPGIRFGSGNVGEGISSARAGTNQWGIDLYTSFISRVSITNGGNVGIGTRSPGDALDVVGTAHVDFNEQNIGNFAPNLVFGMDGSGEGISSTRSQGTTNKWGLDFWTNRNREMSITNAGNVGIGTATPGQKLSVAGVIQSSTGGFMFPDGSVQTQASTGGGVRSITAGLGLTGGTITTSGTIGIDTTVVPRLSAANTFNASQTINGNLSLNTVIALGGQFSGANGGVIGQDSETDSTVRYGVQGLANGIYGVGVRGGGYYGANVVPSPYYAGGGVGVFGAGALGVIGYAGPGISNGSEGVYGQGPSFGVYSNGNFAATGTKSAVVPLPDNRVVLLYAMESPEVWFEDLGSATLKDGVAVITLDPTFALTVNTTVPYHVYVTPAGDCEGLYVTKKTPGSFEVRELRGGRSNTAFEYRVIGKRSGFEDRRLERLQADAETVQAMREQSRTRPTRVPSIKIREGAGSPEITSPKRNP